MAKKNKFKWNYKDNTADRIFSYHGPMTPLESYEFKMSQLDKLKLDQNIKSAKYLYDIPDDFTLLDKNIDEEYKDAREWLWNWYQHPTTKHIINHQNETKSYDKELHTALSIPVTRNSKFYQNFADGIFSRMDKLPSDDMSEMIFVRDSNNLIHELNHSIQYRILPQYTENSKNSTYNQSQIELHSNLQDLRKGLGLHPGKRDYTEEDVKDIEKAIEKSNSKQAKSALNFIKRSNPDNFYKRLQDMLNNWAKKDSTQNIIQALNGGSVPYLRCLTNKKETNC